MQNDSTTYILTFHGLGDPGRQLPDGEDHYWLEPSFFDAILDLVKNRDDVRLTFDDSNSSDFTIAYPALLKRGLTATFFLVSRRIDVAGYLTTAQIRTLSATGMTIGSHGTLHRPWANLNSSDLNLELRDSKRTFEQLISKKVDEAACPLGSYNRRVLKGLKSNGYLRIYTSDCGPSTSNAWFAPRNTIVRSHTLEQVRRIIEVSPALPQSAFRALKLFVKRWR